MPGDVVSPSAIARVEASNLLYTSNSSRPMGQICATNLRVSRGGVRALQPAALACEGEMSAFRLSRGLALASIYGTCDFNAVLLDVPNDDLGTIAGYEQTAGHAQAHGRSQQAIYSQDMSGSALTFSPLTDTVHAQTMIALGVQVRFAAALTATTQLVMSTTGIVDGTGFPLNRSVTIEFEEGCQTSTIYLPLGGPDNNGVANSSYWTSRCGFIPAAAGGVVATVSGPPSSVGGSIAVAFMGPNHAWAPRLAGGVRNTMSGQIVMP